MVYMYFHVAWSYINSVYGLWLGILCSGSEALNNQMVNEDSAKAIRNEEDNENNLCDI